MGIYTPNLSAKEEVVQPERELKVYDKERLEFLKIETESIGAKVACKFKFRNYSVNEAGYKEDAPIEQKTFVFSDLVGIAQEIHSLHPEENFIVTLLQTMGMVEAVAKRIKDHQKEKEKK